MHSVLSRTIYRPIFHAKSPGKRKIIVTRDRLSRGQSVEGGARDEITLLPIAVNTELDHHKLELLARKSLGWLAQPPVPQLPIFESESSQVCVYIYIHIYYSSLHIFIDKRYLSIYSTCVQAMAFTLLAYMLVMVQFVSLCTALPSMATAGLDPADAGTILGAAGAATAVGKFLHSAIARSLPAKTAMVGVLLTAAGSNLALSTAHAVDLPLIIAFVSCTRLGAAGAWISATRIIQQWVPEQEQPAALGRLAFSSRSGVMLGSLSLGSLLASGYTYDTVFRAAAGAGIVVSLIVWELLPTPLVDPTTSETTKDDPGGEITDGNVGELTMPGANAVPDGLNTYARTPDGNVRKGVIVRKSSSTSPLRKVIIAMDTWKENQRTGETAPLGPAFPSKKVDRTPVENQKLLLLAYVTRTRPIATRVEATFERFIL